MAKKLAVAVLILAGLLVPTVSSTATGTARLEATATEALVTLTHNATALASTTAGAAIAALPPLPPRPGKCPLGVWISREAVPVLKQHGSYTHTNDLNQAATYFSQLNRSGTIRTLRAVSLDQMRQLAADAKRRGIPYEALTYDLEGWDQTPIWEQEHQVEATRMARDIAHSYGKLLIMGPARAFTYKNWPKMAPYADMWVIQAQGGQRSYPANQEFYNWLRGYVNMLRPYHRDMPIWVQLSTQPDTRLTLRQYMAYVDLVMPSLVDGVYVFNPGDLPLADIWQAACQ